MTPGLGAVDSPLVVDSSSEKLEVARAAADIEATVFGEMFGDERRELEAAYSPYTEQSVFLLARVEARPSGMMRLGLPGPLQAKTLVDTAVPPFDVPLLEDLVKARGSSPRVLDLMTVAVVRPWRGSGVFDDLLEAAVAVGKSAGCTDMIAVIDEPVLKYLRKRGLDFKTYGSGKRYFGSSSSVPCSMIVDALCAWLQRDEHRKRSRSRVYMAAASGG